MRIRWRGLELPSRIIRDETVSTDVYGRFMIEPFEQGFGTTVGNSLRRVLLSSLEGAAVTTVSIDRVSHEFTTIEGVLEDVTDILLNIKGLVLSLDSTEEEQTIIARRDKTGEIRAKDFEVGPAIKVANPEHLIATLTANVPFEARMTVRSGRGYATASDNRAADQPLGVIPIDSVFSPVTRVRYRTEAMRVGQKTNYDRLIMEIWTKGTILPQDALMEAGLILRKFLTPFVMSDEIGRDMAHVSRDNFEVRAPLDAAREDLLDKPVSILNLSVRSSNCLEAAKVQTLRDLVKRSEAELLRFRSFGKTSLHEVQRKLSDVGLSLGMRLSDGEDGMSSDLDDSDDAVDADPAASGGSVADAGHMEVFTMGE